MSKHELTPLHDRDKKRSTRRASIVNGALWLAQRGGRNHEATFPLDGSEHGARHRRDEVDTRSTSLLDAVRRAEAGEPVVASAVLARMMDHFRARPPVSSAPLGGFDTLSEREREILALIGAGLSNGEIAEELVISMATVKTHVRHVAKLDLRDRVQAVVAARDADLQVPPK